MALGLLLSGHLSGLTWMVPYLLFLMLFFTFSSVKPKELSFAPWHIWLIAIQVVGSLLVYMLFRNHNPIVAQGAMICVLAPTATASVVIGQLLGAKIESMITYTLLCNAVVAIAVPLALPLVGAMPEMPFWSSVLLILGKVVPIIVLPIVAAFLIRWVSTRAIKTIARGRSSTLYLWGFMLMLTIGQLTESVKVMPKEQMSSLLYLGIVALVLAPLQFGVGRAIGKRYGEPVAVAQSLGQKNTVLAIWLAQTYLHPVSSFAPATYILWQNIINSLQVWYKKRKEME